MSMLGQSAIEHGAGRGSRWLRDRRFRIALWVAVIEGVLLVVHVIPWWVGYLVAALVLAFYIWFGRTSASPTMRQASWIAAASQALIALIPILVIIVGTVALVAVGILAVIALIFLFADRR